MMHTTRSMQNINLSFSTPESASTSEYASSIDLSEPKAIHVGRGGDCPGWCPWLYDT
jgi:hypothetical protein